MQALILGNSSIVRRRVRPALDAVSGITRSEIASHSTPDLDYADYETALAESEAELVYISLVNSEHGHWARRALETGHHVVVDKPAFLDLEEAERLVELSRSRTLCLAEATVFTRHPQFRVLDERFARLGSRPTRLVANFSFPPLEKSDFRYQSSLGGGALNDLGPYAVSPGRFFWGDRPTQVECRLDEAHEPPGVETAFSVLLSYPEGRSMVGQFGFTTAYRNRLSLLGPDCCVDVDRAFTTPPDLEGDLHISDRNESGRMTAPAGDSFAIFLQEVIHAIAARDMDDLRNDLLYDAHTLEALRRSAGRIR